ncbi:MAG TPA: FAD-binding protein [Candidatus Binataceae bacterium]|nr:FAD-binding protein [Candidatus Binataceae bacterium]
MLKIAVCIKQIPLVEDANFDPVTKTIRRDGVNVMSAYDLRAIAQAVELKKRFGADTTVITMGPPQAREVLIDALGMGIDHAIHLEDRAFAGSDTLATARTLAMRLARGTYDLVLLGKYSLDAETGQVGPEVAELLGFSQITGVRKLSVEGTSIFAERESEEGIDEVEARMPALLTCAERLIQPLKINPAAREAAMAQPIEAVRAAELSSDAAHFGFAGSPTLVQGVRAQEPPKVQCEMIDATDPELAAERVIDALERLGALRPRVRNQRPIAAALRKPSRGRDVWVVVETKLDGQVTLGTLELLSAGDALATQMGGALSAVLFPGAATRHAGLLASYGADQLILLDNPLLENYSPDTAAAAMAALVSERTPWALLLSASERGRDWGPRLAARLKLGLTGDAIGLELDGEGRMISLKPAFGGNIVAPILSKTYPQMATVRQGVLEIARPNPQREARLERVSVKLDEPMTRLVREISSLDETIAPLDGAEVVVGLGMGVGGPEGVEKAKELARVTGAALCATRRVTDQGWVPRQLQVGLTGKTIEPRLYFSIGIRGGPNHTVGIKRAQTVVAINNDPEAAIFERANLGLVGDWAPLTQALTEAFRRRGFAGAKA